MVKLQTIGLLFVLAIWLFDVRNHLGPISFSGATPRAPSAFRRAAANLPETAPAAPRTAFVTGANGFLGCHLVEQLAAAGWMVTAMHRRGSNVKVLQQLQAAFGAERIQLVTGDVTDRASLAAAMPEHVGTVFHVAAGLGMSLLDRERNYAVNVLGTRHVVDAALERKAAKLVHTSTVAVFLPPTAAAAGGTVDESFAHTARYGSASYPATKALAEDEVRAGIADGLWATIVNPGAIIGKYDATSFGQISRLVKDRAIPMVVPGGQSTCSAVEVARAHIAAAERGRLGENYIVAGPVTPLKAMVDAVGNSLGVDTSGTPVMPPWLMRALGTVLDVVSEFTGVPGVITSEMADLLTNDGAHFSSEKAVQELGYNASVPAADLIAEMVAWQLAEGLLD